MLVSSMLYLLIFIIALVILIDYIDNKLYQNKKHQKSTPEEPSETIKEIKKTDLPPQEEPEPQVEELEETQEAKSIEEVPEETSHETIEPEQEETQPEPVEIVEEVLPEAEIEETKELPTCEYPPFTHVRLVEMGLSDDEATEFVNELIPQLEEQIPLIEIEIANGDFHQVERLTHGIKGSATNLGTGGISDLLVEYNTYLKSGTDIDVVKAYQVHFIHYIEELKKQYA